MYIREVLVKNFGKLKMQKFKFSPGINVIYGENEAGKSTLQQFLLGMLFGMEKQRGRGSKSAPYEKYEPWEAPAYYAGSMRFSTGGKDFYLERNFYHKEKRAYLRSEQDGEELSVEHGDLQMLMGGISREAYENTFFIRQEEMKPKANLSACIQDELHNLSETGDGSFGLTQALSCLQKEKKSLENTIKQEEARRQHELELLRAKESVLREDCARLQEKYERQREMQKGSGEVPQQQAKKQPGRQPEKDNGRDEMQKRQSQAAQMTYFNPAVALGIVLSLVWFLFRQQRDIPLPLWIVGQIILLAVIVWGLAATWKREKAAESGRKEQTGLQVSETAAGADAQQAVLEMVAEALREKEIELENNRGAQQELLEKTGSKYELQRDWEAVSLAEETIAQLSEELGAVSTEVLDAAAAKIFSQITGGKYQRLKMTEKYEPQVMLGHKEYRPEQFSGGTAQQIYFASRMAAGAFLEQDEPLPFLLDEVFSMYDDKRLKEVLRWLGDQKRQVFLFTCQQREREYLTELGIPFCSLCLAGGADTL